MKTFAPKALVKGIALGLGLTAVGAFAANSSKNFNESFNATYKLLTALSITENAALDFGEEAVGYSGSIVIAPADGAQFSVSGHPNYQVQASIVESSINMTTGDGVGATKQIPVGSWTFGGNLNGSGLGTLDGSGSLTNMRVGATATVEDTDIAGDYSGSATFRLVYTNINKK